MIGLDTNVRQTSSAGRSQPISQGPQLISKQCT